MSERGEYSYQTRNWHPSKPREKLFLSAKEEAIASRCGKYGNRPDADKKPECNDCGIIEFCSALTLRKLLAVKGNKRNVDIIHDKMFVRKEETK